MNKDKMIIIITDKDEVKGYFGVAKTKFAFKNAVKHREAIIPTVTLANVPIEELNYLGYSVYTKFNHELEEVESYIEPKPDLFDKIIDAIFFRNL